MDSPANKAWVTRRANAAKSKRSEAANKAWVTRRAAQAAQPAVAALNPAQKAWATRRANGWVHPASR